jgi:hypothetical protein
VKIRCPNHIEINGLVQEKFINRTKKRGVRSNQNRSKPERKLKNVEFENAE